MASLNCAFVFIRPQRHSMTRTFRKTERLLSSRHAGIDRSCHRDDASCKRTGVMSGISVSHRREISAGCFPTVRQQVAAIYEFSGIIVMPGGISLTARSN